MHRLTATDGRGARLVDGVLVELGERVENAGLHLGEQLGTLQLVDQAGLAEIPAALRRLLRRVDQRQAAAPRVGADELRKKRLFSRSRKQKKL